MKLDAQQLDAVTTNAHKTMCIAGAGSGKTRVLVERAAYLIEDKGASPFELIIFSFTRKASSELKTRLIDRLGSKAKRITAGTSHSIAAEMIRRYDPDRTGNTIYGPIETNLVLKDVAVETGVFKKSWKPARGVIDGALLDYGARGILPDESHPAHGIISAFRYRCGQNRALTYDDLLVEFLALIPTLAKYLNWRHLLVDEIQDLTSLQWAIVDSISEHFGASVFAVGDPDQSVYSFRGADPDHMIHNCPEYQRFLLETNYRSLPGIVAAGNNVIRHNLNRIEKTSVAFRPETQDANVTVLRDIDSAAIVSMLEEIPKEEEIAVLARNHFLLKKISTLLTEAGIDHIYAGSKNDMLRELPAITLHSFLRLCINPNDNFSFMVIRKILGVTDQEYAEIRLKATMERVGHLVAWLTPKGGYDLFPFFRMNSGMGFLPDAIAALIEFAEFSTDPPSPGWWNLDIGPVIDFVYAWINENQNGDVLIQDYLDYLALFDVQDELAAGGVDAPPPPKVTLGTLHSSKGLEFSTVIIAGLNEGIFPGTRALADDDELSAETNLCYVGVTRAENKLILTVRPEVTFDKYDKQHTNPESRFIKWAME